MASRQTVCDGMFNLWFNQSVVMGVVQSVCMRVVRTWLVVL